MLAPMLRRLNFASDSGRPVSGLVSVKEHEGDIERLDERLAVREARAIKDVDYVFFRRYSDDRSSQVVAYVIDNKDQHLSEAALAELHKRVWLYGGVPLIYVAWPTRVDILTCARGADFWVNSKLGYRPTDQISETVQHAGAISKAMVERFSAFRLVDGTFWDDPRNAPLADRAKRAHESLIQAVVDTDQELDGEKNPLLRRLLLLTVLIKYLEDRRVFPKHWFGKYSRGAKSFLDVLINGEPAEVFRLLLNLERRFNGDIFVLPREAKHQMTKDVLKKFALLVEARTLKKQRYLWEQFSFEHIPVEIVSHLYQRFVRGGHGTVYTPPFLAGLLLDYAMPYYQLTGKERVLDPACGSGVFLVGAFRRLVNFHRARSHDGLVDVSVLKGILKNSIFGVELDSGAIDLASFSLALAVCDVLKPEVIWTQLKFDRLRGGNLVEGDFFSEVRNAREGKTSICGNTFDIILGNPPFESDLTDHGKILDQEVGQVRGRLPDSQAAYLFLEQGIEHLKPKGRLCLVQPSGILYNKKAATFRSKIMTSAKVEMVMDFTSIRNLYEAADPKTVAFLVSREKPSDSHIVQHLTFRRTFGTRERIAFEIDHYDWHWIPLNVATNDPYIWRLNLLGGGRLISLSMRLRAFETLEEFTRRHSLDYGEGFIVGNRKQRSAFLTGMKYLPAEALENSGINRNEIGVVVETHFEGPREQVRYQPPLILIRKNERLPMAFWNEGPLAFTSTIVAIGAGSSNVTYIEELFARLNEKHRTYMLACMLHGSKAFVSKATATLKQDIDSLPLPEDGSELDLCFWEQVLEDDTLDYFSDFVRLGQNSSLLTNAATLKQVQQYSDLFCRMLAPVYDNIQSLSSIVFDGLICQPFFFGEKPESPWFSNDDRDEIRRLIYQHHHDSLRTVRMLRMYTGNMLLIVKPDRLRFWIRSTAIRDADETIVSLREQGY